MQSPLGSYQVRFVVKVPRVSWFNFTDAIDSYLAQHGALHEN